MSKKSRGAQGAALHQSAADPAHDESDQQNGAAMQQRHHLSSLLRGSKRFHEFLSILEDVARVERINEKPGVVVVKAPNGNTAHVSKSGELSPNYMKNVAFRQLKL